MDLGRHVGEDHFDEIRPSKTHIERNSDKSVSKQPTKRCAKQKNVLVVQFFTHLSVSLSYMWNGGSILISGVGFTALYRPCQLQHGTTGHCEVEDSLPRDEVVFHRERLRMKNKLLAEGEKAEGIADFFYTFVVFAFAEDYVRISVHHLRTHGKLVVNYKSNSIAW